ncbi:cellulose binding domain-containing protein [Sinosporangium siamense]|uniref:Chitinase n=1 Tax=Sinosporangium siamense TaxID=1367973 RepID=A0A919V5E7_9ACTN|nr:cellulose binding domain-containing protein [Sinosporangium siamense]GII91473.1 chitinase [Sinosporangium siamense]
MRNLRILFALLLATAGVLVATTPAYAANVTAAFTKVGQWGSAFEGRYTVKNETPAPITSWKVEFDLPAGGNVSSAWDAVLTRSGTHFTFTNVGWNGTVAPGATVSFGFIASPGSAVPLNCRVNDRNCDGGDGPGTPVNFRVTGSTETGISLAWDAAAGAPTGYRVYEGTTVKWTGPGTSTTIGGLGTCESHTYVVKAYNAQGESNASAAVTGSTIGCPQGQGKAAPYLFLGWGNPPSPATVMNATGIKHFTMAFILAQNGCNPAWDSQRPLLGGADQAAINQIRAAGGDVVPSIGGWSGNKLGPNCATPQLLAGAYQRVIDAYNLTSIDVDIENTDEFENAVVQDRVLNALKIVKQNNPGIKTILTFGTTRTGPNPWGIRLINQAAALQAGIDVFTIMPFDFGSSNVRQDTINASESLKAALKTAFGWTDAQAYSHMGISGMNGLSDQQEMTSTADWTAIRDWAKARGLARLAFWAVNRDRPCPGGGVTSTCSGIAQPDWEFTRISAGF